MTDDDYVNSIDPANEYCMWTDVNYIHYSLMTLTHIDNV